MIRAAFVCRAYESLGVEYLSASLRAAGHRTRLFLDPSLFDEPGGLCAAPLAALFDDRPALLEDLAAWRPDLVCFSVVSDDYRWAQGLARRVRVLLPGARVVFGGPHPSAVPERVLAGGAADVCCVGEGEAALVELADALAAGRPRTDIPGLFFRVDGGVVRNAPRPPLEDLDLLPRPDKALFYDAAGAPEGYLVQASRGCLYACAFCHNSSERAPRRAGGATLRHRSPESVLAELEEAKRRWRPAFVRFNDELFTARPEWLRDFLPAYARRVGLPFDCDVHPAHVDEETAELLRAGGCSVVHMGVQTLDAGRNAGFFGRAHAPAEVARALARLRAAGIYAICDHILGIPGQDAAELERTVEFYLEHPPGRLDLFWLRHYPGTRLTREAVARGVFDAAALARVEEGLEPRGIGSGGDRYDPVLAGWQLPLSALTLLPAGWTRALARRAARGRGPLLAPYPLMVLFRLLNAPPHDIHPARTLRRYLRAPARVLRRRLIRWLRGAGK